MKRYLWNLLLLLDQALNTLTGGDPRERVSSRAGKAMRKGRRWACILCGFLNWFERDHCIKSIQPEAGGEATIPD